MGVKDFHAGLSVLGDIAQSGGDIWTSLVANGIVETLCSNILDRRSLEMNLDYLPSDLHKQVVNIVSSPHLRSQEPLCSDIQRRRTNKRNRRILHTTLSFRCYTTLCVEYGNLCLSLISPASQLLPGSGRR